MNRPYILRFEPVTDFLPQSPAHSFFQLEPDPQEPIARRPGERGRRGDPLVIEFEIGFDFSDMQGLAEFASKDRPDANRVALFDENRHGFERQKRPDARNLLRQADFISGADLDEIVE